MCELKVMAQDGAIIAEDVVYIRVHGDAIELRGILGDITTIHGRIIEINITNESAIIQAEG